MAATSSSFAAAGPPAARVRLPEGPLFRAAVDSCREAVTARENATGVSVDAEAVAAWAAAVPADEAAAGGADRFSFPLRFSEQREEINFAAVLHLLRFGSGHDAALREHKDRTAALSVKFGVMGMHLGGAIDAEAMVGTTLHQVGQLFDVPVERDVEVSPAVYTTKPHPLAPFAEAIRRALNAAGGTLRGLQCKDFCDVVYGVLDREPRSAEALVRRLAFCFAGFDDREGGALVLAKAQALVADLARRFAATDERFAFKDAAELGAAPGDTVPAALRALGLVRVAPGAVADALAAGRPLKAGGDGEVALRAAAVVACDEAARAIRARPGGEAVSAAQLDNYLWSLATGDPPLENFQPHVCRGTEHY